MGGEKVGEIEHFEGEKMNRLSMKEKLQSCSLMKLTGLSVESSPMSHKGKKGDGEEEERECYEERLKPRDTRNRLRLQRPSLSRSNALYR